MDEIQIKVSGAFLLTSTRLSKEASEGNAHFSETLLYTRGRLTQIAFLSSLQCGGLGLVDPLVELRRLNFGEGKELAHRPHSQPIVGKDPGVPRQKRMVLGAP